MERLSPKIQIFKLKNGFVIETRHREGYYPMASENLVEKLAHILDRESAKDKKDCKGLYNEISDAITEGCPEDKTMVFTSKAELLDFLKDELE